MPYNAQTNLYEKEVLDIIRKGQELQRTDLTVSDDMLNNYFLNHAYFIHKKKILVNGAKYIFFIDNYGNIYEFIYNIESDKYWIGYCIGPKYKIELQEIVIDIIKLINTNNETHFKNTIQGIVNINEKYKNNDNLIILEENKQLKDENKQLKDENKQLKENFICPITLAVMKEPVICSDAHTYERSAIEKWLSTNSCSPITRQIITNNILIPNIVLRNIIQEYEKNHKMCF